MEQIQRQLIDPETVRDEELSAKFLALPFKRQLEITSRFLGYLKYEYHKKHFRLMPPGIIVKERWFLQFLSTEDIRLPDQHF